MGIWTKGYKIFEKDMTCRGKQYAENTEYTEDKAEMCNCGMHFCQNPMDVLNFYDLLDDECNVRPIAEVQGEDVKTENIKSVTKRLKIGARLSFAGWIKACFDFLFEKTETIDESDDSDIQSSSDSSAKLAASGYYAQLAASGYSAKLAASGYSAKLAASGYSAQLAASGYYAQLAASGDSAKLAASGYYAKLAASGYYAQLAASGDYAQLAASGYYAQLAASGYSAKLAASGYSAKLAASGEHSIVCAIGRNSIAKASLGSWITLAEFDNTGIVKLVKTEQVDGERIKADTFYSLENGEFVEVIV